LKLYVTPVGKLDTLTFATCGGNVVEIDKFCALSFPLLITSNPNPKVPPGATGLVPDSNNI
jgi:hypothetical protein